VASANAFWDAGTGPDAHDTQGHSRGGCGNNPCSQAQPRLRCGGFAGNRSEVVDRANCRRDHATRDCGVLSAQRANWTGRG